jgi:ferredoxin/flavodoxin---NADP+ reductase
MTAAEGKFYQARIVSRLDVAQDLWKIRIEPGGAFSFVAGQYATLGVRTPEGMIERAYSIASSPYEKELEIFLELVPQGELTPQLHAIPVGGEVTLRKFAKGRFTLDLQSGHGNHLLISTVTGIAPFISYIRTLHKDWKENRFPADIRLYLIGGASRSWEFGYREEVEQVAAEVPWLKYAPTISRPWEDAQWRGETGRVEDVLRKYTDLWQLSGADTSCYLCGHPEMIEHAMGILERRNFSKQHMKQEMYWIPAKEAQA